MNKLMILLAGTIIFFSCSENAIKKAAFNVAENTSVQIMDAEALIIIDSTAKVESLAGGYEWTEGPLYISEGDYVLFSDVPANKVYKWKEGDGASLYLDFSGYAGSQTPEREPGSNGLLLDGRGRLVLCQHGYRRVARMDAPLDAPAPVYMSLADKYRGKKLNSPNDAVFHSNGDLYFTDPPYGLDKGTDDTAKQQPHHGVYRVTSSGEVSLLTGEYDYPNGIALTPDQKFLMVAHSDSDNMVWMKYELDEKGLIKNSSVFYKVSAEEKKLPGAPDGFKINKEGYVFASGPGGIWIFNPAGKLIAKIFTGQATSNCALDTDETTLYMTCDAYLYRIKLRRDN